jgi:hypothetical protein
VGKIFLLAISLDLIYEIRPARAPPVAGADRRRGPGAHAVFAAPRVGQSGGPALSFAVTGSTISRGPRALCRSLPLEPTHNPRSKDAKLSNR